MTTNLTNITNLDSLDEVATFTNNATAGLFFSIIIVAIFFILIMNLRKSGIDRAAAAASFACLLICLPFVYLNLLNILFPIFFGLILAGSLFYIRWNSN